MSKALTYTTRQEQVWSLRAQFNKQNSENPSGLLEANGLACDTREEIEQWWECWGKARRAVGDHSTDVMFDPSGAVVKVRFN